MNRKILIASLCLLGLGIQVPSYSAAGVRDLFKRVTGRDRDVEKITEPSGDLDPKGAIIDPAAPPNADAALVDGLASERPLGHADAFEAASLERYTPPRGGGDQRVGPSSEAGNPREVSPAAQLRRVGAAGFEGERRPGDYIIRGDAEGNQSGLRDDGAAFVKTAQGEFVAVTKDSQLKVQDGKGHYILFGADGRVIERGNAKTGQILPLSQSTPAHALLEPPRAHENRESPAADDQRVPPPPPAREQEREPRESAPAAPDGLKVVRTGAEQPSRPGLWQRYVAGPASKLARAAAPAPRAARAAEAAESPALSASSSRIPGYTGQNRRLMTLHRRLERVERQIDDIEFEALGKKALVAAHTPRSAGDRSARALRNLVLGIILLGAAVAFGSVDFFLYHGSVVSTMLNSFGVLPPELATPALVKSMQSIPAVLAGGYLYHKLPVQLRTPYLIFVALLALVAVTMIGWNFGVQWMTDHPMSGAVGNGIVQGLPAGNGISMNLPGMTAAPAAPLAAPVAPAAPAAGGTWSWFSDNVVNPMSALANVHPLAMALFFIVSAAYGGFFTALATNHLLRLIGAGSLTKEEEIKTRELHREQNKLHQMIEDLERKGGS